MQFMKSFKAVVVLMLAFSALYLGLALAESVPCSGENVTVDLNLSNETLNATTNETLANLTLENQTMSNATLTNVTITNATISNNETELQNDTNPFENVKGRQPSRH
jgi:hypothetical protein